MTRKLLSLLLSLLLAFGMLAALAEDFDGFYDFKAPYGLDTDINMILSPDGHGRLINSTSSVNFDFEIEDGRLASRTEQVELEAVEEGHVVATVAGYAFEFVRRGEVPGGEEIAGAWKASGMESGGARIDAQMLELIGISIDAFFYSSGAISWHSITDMEITAAQGWGADDQGFYMKNGDATLRLLLEGDTLILVYPDSGQGEVKFMFQRAD